MPEPTSWVMLIAGFGMVGAAARRRKTVVAA
ncbi:PEPxxWA-CTERM sorting domain-containing protein [Sandarakinorhabdus sp.]